MEATINSQPQHIPTFEEFMASMDALGKKQEETARQMQETDRKMQETDRKMQETARQMKETDRRIEETRQAVMETSQQMNKTDKKLKSIGEQMGGLHNRFGELVEHLVAPSILEKFNEAGFFFTKEYTDLKIREPSNPDVLVEIDIMLENGDVVIAVEVKAKVKYSDIEDLKGKMEALRREADRHGDARKYRGAVASAIMSRELCKDILKNGFYLIEQTGDTVKLTIPEGFTPREW